MKKYLVALLFLAQAPLASAGVTVYNTEAAFLAHLQQPNYYLEDFSTYTLGSPLDSSQKSQSYGPNNGYSWTASAGNGLVSIPSGLSVNDPTNLLTITFTGDPVTALGGIFSSIKIDNTIPPQVVAIQQLVTITLNLIDSTTETFSLTGSDFRGFTSTIPITGLTIDVSDNLGYGWPALDQFYVGSAPEPAALALLGLGGLLLASWRRYARD